MHGKVQQTWFDASYVSAGFVRHFAQVVLAIVPLLLAFMMDVVHPIGVLERDIECLASLDKVCSFLVSTR